MAAASPLQSVDQALAVLERLASSGSGRTLTSLAREFETSKARMHRLLATMKSRDFVVQDAETLRYRFGSACPRLVQASRAGSSLQELCLPALRRLWAATEETILFAVYQDGCAVVVEKLDSPRPVLARSLLGAVLPVHAVSTGKVLLASRTDAEIDRILAAGLERFTPATCADPRRLRAELDRIRRVGYAVNRDGYRTGVSGVAAPVRWSRRGVVAAAVAVCAPSSRFVGEARALRDEVVAAADEASDALGASVDAADEAEREVARAGV